VGGELDRWKVWAQEAGVPVHQAGEAALEEFGGLCFVGGEPGVDCATTPFVIDPLRCGGDTALIRETAEEIGEQLSPLGWIEEGKAVLVVAESGPVLALGDIDAVVGRTMDDAVIRMVRGIGWDGEDLFAD
jgi:8-oxo-dGTP pyrophosphatase MutT (NUDIX family)